MRQQVVLSVTNAMRGGVQIGPQAADRAWELAKSAAPYTPGSIVARLEYLINSGRNDNEVEASLAFLREHASVQPETWLAEAVWAQRHGQRERAERAIAIGDKLPARSPDIHTGFVRVQKDLEETH